MSKRRYVLLRDEGGGPKPCAFFASAAGCRNAANCKFLHGDIPAVGSSWPPTSAPSKPKEDEDTESAPTATAASVAGEFDISTTKKSKKKKARREEEQLQPQAEVEQGTATVATSVSSTPAAVIEAPPLHPAITAPADTEAPPATAVEEVLSVTKAKKKALREKALKKAAAAEAEAARLAAIGVAPTAVGAPVTAGVSIGTADVSVTKKQKKTKPSAGESATAAANGAIPVANGVAATLPSPAAPTPPVPMAARAGAAAVPQVVEEATVPGRKKKRKNKSKTAKAAEAAAAAAAPARSPTGIPSPDDLAQQIAALQQQQALLLQKASAPVVTLPTPVVPTASTPLVVTPTAAAEVAPPAAAAPLATPKVCAYFNKKKGCKAGALCPFLHQGTERGGFGGTRGHAEEPAAIMASASATTTPLSAPTPAAPAFQTSTQSVAAMPPSPAAGNAHQTPLKPPTTCVFYGTAAGCKNGAACPFVHSGPAVITPVAQTAASTPSLVSPVSTPAAQTNGLQAPAAATAAISSPLVPASAAATPQQGGTDSSRATRKRGRTEASASNNEISGSAATGTGTGGGGVELLAGLPVSPFVAPPPKGSKKAVRTKANKNGTPAEAAAVTAAIPAGIPHPKADPWQELVDRTRAHPGYENSYRFETDSTWITAAPCGDACSGLPQVVAMDCEMCMSEDPVSKVRNGKDLVRVSVVRGEDGSPLMDTLVRPVNPVVSWRTHIHGVARAHLEGVLFTHRHAQTAMARICCQHTIIIGHALFNDLEALKMSHGRVIDTSYLFVREGTNPNMTPSLRDVVSAALGKQIQEGAHDSVTDAQCTLDVARFALENGPQAPVPRLKKKRGSRGEKWAVKKRRRRSDDDGLPEDDSALTVHRLPKGTTEQQLLRLMQKKTNALPIKADPIDFTTVFGKTQVYFETPAHAAVAFDAISTASGLDSSGRQQKRVYISGEGKMYIQVRQNVLKDGANHDKPGLHIPSESSSSGGEGDGDDDGI